MKGKVFLFLTMFLLVCLPLKVRASEPIIIMIDPGHGGENLGAEYQREDVLYWEKDMTLITALAMKEELEKYDNVTVYLTRETDVEKDIPLKQRVKAAKEKNAAVLISLHYNMSVSHILYGAEVWVPSVGKLYSDSAALATEFMKEFDEKGLFHRGIKTRLNDKGTDYYGILRNAVEQNIPAMIIEHCHLDNERDYAQYGSDELLEEFGKRDATAVAKHFRLVSTTHGYDYSSYEKTEIPVPDQVVAPDITEPEKCEVIVENYDTEKGNITLNIKAEDTESEIFYYAYSYDNGLTYSPLLEWGDGTDVTVSFSVENNTTPRIVVKAYNAYDIFKESMPIVLDTYVKKEEPKPVIHPVEIPADTVSITKQAADKEARLMLFVVCFCCAVVVFVVVILVRILHLGKAKNSKRNLKRKNKK